MLCVRHQLHSFVQGLQISVDIVSLAETGSIHTAHLFISTRPVDLKGTGYEEIAYIMLS